MELTIFVLSGLPASGKTTYSKQLANQYNATVYCYDELKKDVKYFRELKPIKDKMINDALKVLENGSNVVIDDLNISRQSRKTLLQKLKSVPCKRVCIVMATPLDECTMRNAIRDEKLPMYILQDIYNHYETPTLDEGWDEIITI